MTDQGKMSSRRQNIHLQVVRGLVHLVCNFFNHYPLQFQIKNFDSQNENSQYERLKLVRTCVLISVFMSSAMFLRRATPCPIWSSCASSFLIDCQRIQKENYAMRIVKRTCHFLAAAAILK